MVLNFTLGDCFGLTIEMKYFSIGMYQYTVSELHIGHTHTRACIKVHI